MRIECCAAMETGQCNDCPYTVPTRPAHSGYTVGMITVRAAMRALIDAADEMYRISERKHDAWIAYATARAALEPANYLDMPPLKQREYLVDAPPGVKDTSEPLI